MIAIGCDHGGFDLKCAIVEHLKEKGVEFKDFGIFENTSVDYPDIAKKVADSILSGECERGILVCGTGIGMSIAANKIKGIRAAACSEVYSAEYCRLHNDANILCLGGRVIGPGTAVKMVDVFLKTEFEGGRHSRRVGKIASFEG
ncbi:MAG TPA: ribose 5-phosphate isomerase B [Clostridiales bacterium]|nr:ribose 5-phosphate isomerase B [Clostridiales bacterium]